MYQSLTLPPTPDTVETNYPSVNSSAASVTTPTLEGGTVVGVATLSGGPLYVPPTEYQVNEEGHHVARPTAPGD